MIPWGMAGWAMQVIRTDTGELARARAVSAVCAATDTPRFQMARMLLRMGAVEKPQIVRALRALRRDGGELGDILCAQGAVSRDLLHRVRGLLHGTTCLDPSDLRPDPRLVDLLGAERCLALMCLPLRRAGAVTLVATAQPARFAALRPRIEAALGPVAMAITTEADLHRALLQVRRDHLRRWAETCVAERDSCRALGAQRLRVAMWALAGAVGGALALMPVAALLGLTLLASAVLVLTSALRLAAAFAAFGRKRPGPPARCSGKTDMQDGTEDAALPVITILVPLFREAETVERLINRLSRLTWPRHLLDVILVTEECDHLTARTLATTTLPGWMRVITVPDAPLRTKPRALNYATLFARGTIIGVYDAEDAPEPDQLHRVHDCFRNAPPDLACVQGVLDFYNPTTNWMARCFTIEYATWFRVILPGLERLGLAVPLGGTTLFFRRDLLDALGGWDAHNVTEDADLGVRLARRGYRTQLLDTVTYEEANCRPLPWIRQRSRWLKGYAITWAVHMRDPVQLWRDLGAWRFAGFQVQFLGTLVQFALAPLLWSFWLVFAGLDHPFLSGLPGQAFLVFMAIFLLAEAVTLSVGFVGLRARHHAGLRFWLPALHLYFPLAVAAVYKALWEIGRAPFYWDKTAHGAHGASLDACRVARQS